MNNLNYPDILLLNNKFRMHFSFYRYVRTWRCHVGYSVHLIECVALVVLALSHNHEDVNLNPSESNRIIKSLFIFNLGRFLVIFQDFKHSMFYCVSITLSLNNFDRSDFA